MRGKKVCKIEGCGAYCFGNGLCGKHYRQMRDYGKIFARTIKDPNDFIIDGSICRIGCYDLKHNLKGYIIIDAEDSEKCKPFKWNMGTGGPVAKGIVLTNLIMNNDPTTKLVVDHKDRNTWDNRKDNLRICTVKENARNRVHPKNKSGYRGVSWSNKENKWIATIQHDSKQMRLGCFTDIIEAAKMYNMMAKELHGEFAVLNKIPLIRRRNG
jgi:hypothetical protein